MKPATFNATPPTHPRTVTNPLHRWRMGGRKVISDLEHEGDAFGCYAYE